MRKAIFLDKDGTLVYDVPYNINLAKLRLVHGALPALQKLKNEGYLFIVVSNQQGLALGYFTWNELHGVSRAINKRLCKRGIEILDYYYCPHRAEEEKGRSCRCRKPRPGLLLSAAKKHQINLADSWMIGDILNDVEAGNRAGCKTILINNGNETEWETGKFRKPDFTVRNLKQAAITISGNSVKASNKNRLSKTTDLHKDQY